ncbi:MAG: BrnT family toxin [Candidatus Sumerlaeota bacterium]|nr:BrnT family toxin [Candidatus Sumerlaeota bacterium]
MRFTWDQRKRQKTLMKRGLDFAHAQQIFDGPTFTVEDDREDYGEQRWVTMGLLREKVVVVVHTETKGEIRIISMREAEKDEQIQFFRNL